MKYFPSRRLARPPRPTKFPPDPLMLELNEAGQRGNDLLGPALQQIERRSKLSQWFTIFLIVLAIAAVYFLRWLHPEWPWPFFFPTNPFSVDNS